MLYYKNNIVKNHQNMSKNMEPEEKLKFIQGSLNQHVTMSALFGMQVTPQSVDNYYKNVCPGVTTLDEVRKLIKEGKIYKLEHHCNYDSNFSDDF